MKKYIWILFITLSLASCKPKEINLHRIEGKQIAIDTILAEDNTYKALIAPYKEKLESKMSTVLAYATKDHYKRRGAATLETSIGNFMADLCYTRGNPVFKKIKNKNIDFVLLNFGGIRAGIPKGAVTTRNAYEIMPFENSMVVTELSYEKLQELLTYLAKGGIAHPISKELQLEIDGKTVAKSTIKGKEINKNKTYHVLTSDYLQNGGDHMDFFKDPIKLYNLNYKIRDAIIDELKAIDTITAVKDGRFVRI